MGQDDLSDIRRMGSFNALGQDFLYLRGHVDQRFEQVDRGFAESPIDQQDR